MKRFHIANESLLYVAKLYLRKTFWHYGLNRENVRERDVRLHRNSPVENKSLSTAIEREPRLKTFGNNGLIAEDFASEKTKSQTLRPHKSAHFLQI